MKYSGLACIQLCIEILESPENTLSLLKCNQYTNVVTNVS
jgi:hypothetical protein